jgi:pseudouridine synthase
VGGADGRVPNAVLRAKENHAKVYQVTTRYDLYEEELQQLRDGVVITTLAQRDGRRAQELTAPTLPCEVEWGPYANTVLITLREGRNRQIRKMLEAIGNEVIDLHRVEVMGIGLDGLPREDMWKDLSEREMEYVRNAINLSARS